MKKKTLLTICYLLFIVQTASFAQTAPEYNSGDIIRKGIELHDDKKYDEAAKEFKKVNRSDTNYVLASVELVNTYITDGKDSLALIVCNNLLDLPSSYVPNVLVYKANALDNLKRSDEAIKVYEDGMKRFPLNYSFTYEMGILKMHQEKYKEAYDWFVQSVKVNPYHANTHLQLGLLAVKQGKLVQAMLAWQFYLTIDNSSATAQSIVTALEKMAKNEYDFGTPVKVDELENKDDFSDIETLVKSKVALSAKYKSETKLNFSITKQIQLIMEKMVVSKDDNGFFMQFYAPFYSQLYKNKYLETYSYQILAGMGNKEVDAWMKKNTDKTDALLNWEVNYIAEGISFYDEELNGKMVKARHYYSKANRVLAVGNMNAKNEKIGYWNYYYPNGMKKSEGAFNDKGLRTGVWKYYATTGLIRSTENYVNDEVEGQVENYYSNGSILSQRNFTKSLMEGDQVYFYPTGSKKIMYQYKANIENGKEKQYHENGALEYEISVVADKFQGAFVKYYMDGHLKEKSDFKDSKRTGKFTEYYDLPENAIQQEGSYENGRLSGTFKSYHRNGVMSETGEYKDGEKNGTWRSFNENNILISEETYNNGKNSGICKYYSYKGKLNEEFIYKNDMLQEYKAYDNNGKVIYQNKKEGKNNYDATLYYPNGNKKREGRVKNGMLDGVWKDYTINGFVKTEVKYVDGKKDGKQISYHENGTVKYETDYTNGETDGFYKVYYKNGKVKQEGAYIKDKEVSVWNSYYIDGTLKAVNFYNDGSYDNWQQYFCANGKIDYEDFIELNYLKKRLDYDSTGKQCQESVLDKGTGLLDIRYPNGKPYFKVSFKDNLKQGAFISFYANGKQATIKNYVDNKLHGDVKYFYPSGKIRAEESYLNGDLNGKTLNYYENGNVKSDYNYVYGNEEGISYFYYPAKQVQTKYPYKNNQLEGSASTFNEAGELMIIKNFEENILVSYQYNDKMGNLVPPVEVKNETGNIKAYYKSGSLSMEYTLKNGAIEGKKTAYFSNGKISEEANFVCDERDGIRKFYYPSGKIKNIENWQLDNRMGNWISYYENGKVKTQEFYINDNKFGAHMHYDESGNLTKTYFYYDDKMINEK